VSGTPWGCEPGLFIRRPVRDFLVGYTSPSLLRLNAGCVGFIRQTLVDDLLGPTVCALFQAEFCGGNPPEGVPRDLIDALCPNTPCAELAPEYNEILAEGFCQAFPRVSPGLISNTTTPVDGINKGVQKFYSGEGANSLARYYTTFNGQDRNVVFDNAIDETIPRDAWANLANSGPFDEWLAAGNEWLDPNVVAGHAFSQVPKGIKEGSVVELFVPTIQRNLRFENSGGRKAKVKGLETLVFDITAEELLPYTSLPQNTEEYYRNQAFYNGGQRTCVNVTATPPTGCAGGNGAPAGFENWAIPPGNLNVSTTKKSAPIFASRPYWFGVESLDADATVGSDVLVYDPANCDDFEACDLRLMSDVRNDADAPDKWASQLNIFARMGFTIGANVRLQVHYPNPQPNPNLKPEPDSEPELLP
jgi:hypothetical protein